MIWLVFLFVAITAVAVRVMGVPAGLLRLAALVGGGQFVTHLTLTALAGHAGDHRPSPAPSAASGSREPPMANVAGGRRGSFYDMTMGPVDSPTGAELRVPHWLTHVLGDLTGPHAAMAVAHLAAAIVVAWWLSRGERALWALIALLGASVFLALSRLVSVHCVTAIAGRQRTARTTDVQLRLRRRLAPLTSGQGRRGPPLLVI